MPLNRIVLNFIKFYVSKNQNTTYEDLCDKFPRYIQGSFGVIKKVNDLNESDKGYKRANKQPNFFLDEPITLKNGCKIVVCNQWGNGGSDTNFESFIRIVNKLNYNTLTTSFNQAVSALMLEGIPEEKTPKLYLRDGVTAEDVILVNPSSQE